MSVFESKAAPLYAFFVDGESYAKQSFRFSSAGHYKSDAISGWEDTVGWLAKKAVAGREPLEEPIAVSLDFLRSTKRRVDLDNLAKPVLDGLEGVVFENDDQIVELRISKSIVEERPGVQVEIYRLLGRA